MPVARMDQQTLLLVLLQFPTERKNHADNRLRPSSPCPEHTGAIRQSVAGLQRRLYVVPVSSSCVFERKEELC